MNDGKIERELEQQISFVIWLFKGIEVSQAVLLLTIEKAESKAKKKTKKII